VGEGLHPANNLRSGPRGGRRRRLSAAGRGGDRPYTDEKTERVEDRTRTRLRALGLGARILGFAYLAFAVLWALVVLGILAYAIWPIEYQWTALLQVWQVPFLVALGVLHFVHLCELVLFAVGLYRLGEELGSGFNAKLVRVGAVVLVPLGFVGAALAYAGLRRRI